MKVRVLSNPDELGKEAAMLSVSVLNKAISTKGKARLVLSTGASQFDTLRHLVMMGADWKRVEMFHLDEYIGLPDTHPASFRKYLSDRFVSLVHPGKVFWIEGEGDVSRNIAELTEAIREEPIDLALIGIGENGHIAFNDPPADLKTREAFKIVDLDERCKNQQVREGWFSSVDEVPKQAISMTVHQIMQSKVIVSAVPYIVKANAVKLTLENEVTNMIPATKLKEHGETTLFLDVESASMVSKELLVDFT